MIQKIFKTFSFFLLAGFLAKAQTIPSTAPALNNNLIPPSPEAASIAKYGILPVTLYTGSANISVPVFDIKTPKLELPISFGYNYNGYRPNETSGMVGMGWALEGAEGVITRQVRGLVDDDSPGTPWLTYANITDLNSSDDLDFLSYLGTQAADGEPDLYIFHFNGHSGKFILIGSRAYLFSKENLKIEKKGNFFIITDEDGMIYNFNFLENTTLKGPTNVPNPFPTAWYLSGITSADQSDAISFQYSSYNAPQSGEGYSDTYRQNGNGVCNGTDAGCDLFATNYSPVQYLATLKLQQINFRNGYIQFIPESTARQDLGGEFALGEIDVYSSSSLIKKIQLQHGYFQGPVNGTGAGPSQLRLDEIDTYGNNGVASPKETYTFQYANQTSTDFPRFTRSIDYFGYYNGVSNLTLFNSTIVSYNTPFAAANRDCNFNKALNGALTKITYPTGGYTQLQYDGNTAYVDVSGHAEQSYCTTNTTVSNTITVTNTGIPGGDDSLNGGGEFTVQACPYITQIPVTLTYGQDAVNPSLDPKNNQYNILKIYQFTQQGKVYVFVSPHVGYDIAPQTVTLLLQPGDYMFTITCNNDPSETHLKDVYATISNITQFNQQAYNNTVQNGFPACGIRIKTITSYDGLSTVPMLTRNYSYSPAVILNNVGYDEYSVYHHQDNAYTENIFSSNFGSPVSTLLADQYYYPTVTEMTDASGSNGKTVYSYGGTVQDALQVQLLSKTDYGLNNLPLKSETNTYSYHKSMDFYGLTCHINEVAGNMGGYITPLPSPYIYDVKERFALYTAIPYVLESGWNQLDSKQVMTYDQNGLNPLTSTTTYKYNNPDYLHPSQETKNNSKNQPVTLQYLYPLDYGLNGIPSLSSTDLAFSNAQESAAATYLGCLASKDQSAASAYEPGVSNYDNTNLENIINNSACETQYANSSGSAISTMNSAAINYYTDYNIATLPNEGIQLMQDENISSKPVEVIESINKSGTEYLVSATKTDYVPNANASSATASLQEILPSVVYHAPSKYASILKSDFMANPSNYYEARVNFTYDNNCNLIEQNKVNDINNSYIWDYNNTYPIAEVKNSAQNLIAYTSFEADGTGGWSFSGNPIADASSPTGGYCFNAGLHNITSPPLYPNIKYVISYWTKNAAPLSSIPSNLTGGTPIQGKKINGWTYYEHRFFYTSQTNLTFGNGLNDAGKIDELRLYPVGAQMTTYAYTPLVGITYQCDVNNKITSYTYDALGRLSLIMDQDGNIVKKYCYNYAGQQTNCGVSMFYSKADTIYASKTGCGTGMTGTVVPYILPAGSFTSASSQAAADQQPQAASVTQAAQTNANSNGACISSAPINFAATSNGNGTAYTAVFTNLATKNQYTASFPASGAVTINVNRPSAFPTGSYTVTITPTTGTTTSVHLFYVYLDGATQNISYGTSGNSARFYNITIYQGSSLLIK